MIIVNYNGEIIRNQKYLVSMPMLQHYHYDVKSVVSVLCIL